MISSADTMPMSIREPGPWLLSPVLMALSGCSTGAPSFSLFGAYFPAWLACSLLGVCIALTVRAALMATGMGGAIPAQWLACVSAGVVGAIILSWLWLGV